MQVTLSEYLNTSYRPDCDYLDGEVLERNVGEFDHSRAMALLGRRLLEFEQLFGLYVVFSTRVQVGARRIRVPDITVTKGAPDTPIITEPPFLCVEILSPSDRVLEMQDRINDYLAFGVEYVWLIDPVTRRSFIYTRDSIREVRDGVLSTSNPEIRLAFCDLE